MTFAARSKVVPSLLLGSLVTALLLITPAGHAQLPDVSDSVGNVVDSVDEVVGSVGGAAEAAGNSASDTAGDVVDTVDDTSSVAAKDGEEGDPISDVVEVVNGIVGNANDTVEKAVETVQDTSEEVVKDLQGTLKGKPRNDSFNSNGDVRTVGNPGTRKKDRGDLREQVRGNHVTDPSSGFGSSAEQGLTGILNVRPPVPTAEIAAPSSGFSEIVRQAAEATKKIAFPLALSLLVVAYLMLQGRIDRKDPKLAYAPMDAEQDLLSFR